MKIFLISQRLEEMRRELGSQAVGTPEDVAHTVSFLLSPEARFINGQTLTLDGGYLPATSTPAPKTMIQWQNAVDQWLSAHANGHKHPSPV